MDADLQLAIEDFDLEDYLRQKDFEHVGAEEWQGECPHCLKKKVAVNSDLKVFHCWVCQEVNTRVDRMGRTWSPAKGGLVSLVMWLEEISFKDAKRYVLEHCNPEFDLDSLSFTVEKTPTFKGHIEFPPEAKHVGQGMPYLAERGLSLYDAGRYNLHYCEEGKYANRLLFPCYEGNNLVYWQARAMFGPDKVKEGYRYIKVLNPPKEPGAPGSKDVVFNLNSVRGGYDRTVITEGPIDAIRTGEYAVATFGKSISSTQLAKIIDFGAKELVLMWDADAYKEAQVAAQWLASFLPTYLVKLPEGDPGEHDRAFLRELINKAPRVYPE